MAKPRGALAAFSSRRWSSTSRAQVRRRWGRWRAHTRPAVVSPPAFLYMGRDKFENENLIKFGWPEDVWYVVLVTFRRSSAG